MRDGGTRRDGPMVATAAQGRNERARRPMGPGDCVPRPQWGVRPVGELGRSHRRNAARPAPDPGAEVAHEQIIIEHQPHRPDWLCTGCAEPWPCPTARQHLKADVQPTQLAIMMTSWMHEAAGELPHAAPGELWDRFVAWTRHRRG